MTLQFNPYPLEPWLRRQEREQRPDINQTVTQPLLQGLGLVNQFQEMNLASKRQAMLDDYVRREHDYNYNNPLMTPNPTITDVPMQSPMGRQPVDTVSLWNQKFGMGQRPQVQVPQFNSLPNNADPFSQLSPEMQQYAQIPGAKNRAAYAETRKIFGDPQEKEIERRYKESQIRENEERAGYYARGGSIGANGQKPPAGYQFLPDGSLQPIPGGPADKGSADFSTDPSLQVPGFSLTGGVKPGKDEAERVRKASGEYNTFNQVLSEYRDLIQKEGTTSVDPKVRASMDAYAKRLQLIVKNLAQLGVLSASDIPFIEKQITGPGFFKTERGMLGSLDTTGKMAETGFLNEMNARGYSRSGGTPAPLVPAQGGKPKTRVQNGYTYTLNEATGQYE